MIMVSFNVFHQVLKLSLSGCYRDGGHLWNGRQNFRENTVFPGPILHEPNQYTHASDPAW